MNIEIREEKITPSDCFKTPKYIGGYRLGNATDNYTYTQFNLTYKPNWFHRTMMRLCLGFKWVNL